MQKLILTIILLSSLLIGQWNREWSSNYTSYVNASGFLDFEKNGSSWNKKFYIVDSLKFQIMTSAYSTTPLYNYVFNAAERLAGAQVYSLGLDMNDDNVVEFYILAYYGTSTNYRQSFKIFDIKTNTTLFERNDPTFSYSYPVLADVDSDGYLECITSKYNYPALTEYAVEVYSTTVPSSNYENNPTPKIFQLKQNFPNPFNSTTKINFTLDKPSNVTIDIFNSTGELVNRVLNYYDTSGEKSFTWNGTAANNTILPSGMYIYEVKTSDKSLTKKMVLIK